MTRHTPIACMCFAAQAGDAATVRMWLIRTVESAEQIFDDVARGRRQGPVDWDVVIKPYIAGGFRLAGIEWSQGNKETALDLYRKLLTADPNDKLGVRYFLAARLLLAGLLDEFEALVLRFAEDSSTYWRYNRALLAFRSMGDCDRSRAVLEEAVHSNRRVPAYLGGLEPMGALEERVPESGTLQEALHCAHWYAEGWGLIPGAKAWLTKRALPLR